MKTVKAAFAPEWRLRIIKDGPQGDSAAREIAIDFSAGKADLASLLGDGYKPGMKGILTGTLVSGSDGAVILGAGADWWWRARVNGKEVYSRGEEFPDGNAKGTFLMTDWVFPAEVKKGDNTVEFEIKGGTFWSVAAGILDVKDGIDIDFGVDAEMPQSGGLRLMGNTAKDPVSYSVGETMRFRLELEDEHCASEGLGLYVLWNSYGDDGVLRSGIEPISVSDPAEVCVSLGREGFVHFTATLCDRSCRAVKGENTTFDGGAGADIGRIAPSAERPEDFDRFWDGVRKMLDGERYTVKEEQYNGTAFPDGTMIPDWITVSKLCISVSPFSKPVTALLAVPKKPGKYPARVVYDGYSKMPQLSHRLMSPSMLTLHVNAHGYELFREQKYYDAFFGEIEKDGVPYAFSAPENDDPEKCYFYGMAQRVMRSLDYIKTHPMWNGRDLIVRGCSQGGLQAVWGASLDKDVTRAEVSVNWCSNIAGYALGARLPGWHPSYRRGLDYYDTVFHASRIGGKCFFDLQRIGLGDYTCPPSGVTAMYNEVRAPKRVAYYQGSTHMGIPERCAISRLVSPGMLPQN